MTLMPDSEQQPSEKPNLKGDVFNVLLLVYMYTLQSLPKGIANALPLLLQSRKATYTDQVRD